MIKYTKDHDWLDSGDDGVAVGLTDHATGELGDVGQRRFAGTHARFPFVDTSLV